MLKDITIKITPKSLTPLTICLYENSEFGYDQRDCLFGSFEPPYYVILKERLYLR